MSQLHDPAIWSQLCYDDDTCVTNRGSRTNPKWYGKYRDPSAKGRWLILAQRPKPL